MRCPALAEAAIGILPDRSREAVRWARRTEDRGDELVLDRPLARPLLLLPVGEVPDGAVRMRIEPFLRYGGAVGRVEVRSPAGDPRAQFVDGFGQWRSLRGVGHVGAPIEVRRRRGRGSA